MKKYKFVEMINSMNSSELTRLNAFVKSPYHNQDETMIRISSFIQLHYPTQVERIGDKALLHQYLFPNEAYEDKRIRYAMSAFCKLMEQFFTIEALNKHPYLNKVLLLKDLSTRNLEKSYQQEESKINIMLNDEKYNIPSFSLFDLQVAQIKDEHFQQQRIRRDDNNLRCVADKLDAFYYLERLKYTCALLDRQHIIQTRAEIELSEQWLKHLITNNFFNSSTIQAYYIIHQMLTQIPPETFFLQMQNLMEQQEDSINQSDKKEIYLFIINYCARKIRIGEVNYSDTAYKWYKRGIEQRILFDGKELSPWTFTNMVKLSLKLGQHKWTELFIKDYESYLPTDFRQNCIHYNLSELYYYANRLELAQVHLHQVVHSDIHYYLGARLLLAKIYFQLREEEALTSLISAFSIFLKRNKVISNPIKEPYLNFCNLLSRIVRTSKYNSQLKEDIIATKVVAEKEWLLTAIQQSRAN